MTLTRYTIRNEFRLGDPELYRLVDKDDSETLLESIAMAGLVGLLRQLGDLAQFAAEIFHDLHEEVGETLARSHSLVVRVQQLEAEFPPIEKALLSQTDHSSVFRNPGVAWHPNIPMEQNLITRGDAPRFVMSTYEECRDPPRLFLLDKFDVAGAGACLKRYTDPSFFRAKTSSMGMEIAGAHQGKISHKVKKTRSQWTWKNGEIENTASTCTSNSTLHQLFLEDHADNDHSDPAFSIKLKRWQPNGSHGGPKSGKSYMEKPLETPLEHKASSAAPPVLLHQHSPDEEEEQEMKLPVADSFKQEDEEDDDRNGSKGDVDEHLSEDLSSEVDDNADAVTVLETENRDLGFIAALKEEEEEEEKFGDEPKASDFILGVGSSPSCDRSSSCRRSSSSHGSSFSMGEGIRPALLTSSPDLHFWASAKTCSSVSQACNPIDPDGKARVGHHELVGGKKLRDDGDTSSCSSSLSSLHSIVADSSGASSGFSSGHHHLLLNHHLHAVNEADEVDPSTVCMVSEPIKLDHEDEASDSATLAPVVVYSDSSPDGFVSEVEKHVTSIKRYRSCNVEQDDEDDDDHHGGLDSAATAALQHFKQTMKNGEVSGENEGEGDAEATHLENQPSSATESNEDEDEHGDAEVAAMSLSLASPEVSGMLDAEVVEHRCKCCEVNGLEGENLHRKKIAYPKNPVIDDVAAHGTSKLKRVVAQLKAHAGPSLAARDSMLEQIRAKSFKLRPTSAMRPSFHGIQGPKTNWKVAAILEKANAIRQALAGSDEDDNSDGWSDS